MIENLMKNTGAICRAWRCVLINADSQLFTGLNVLKKQTIRFCPPFLALSQGNPALWCVYNHTPKGQVVVLNVDHKSARVTMCNMEITFLKTQMLALHSGEWLLQIDPQLYSPFTICRSRAQTKYPLTQRQLLTLVRPERLRCRNLN
jgi:hypothetical protein